MIYRLVFLVVLVEFLELRPPSPLPALYLLAIVLHAATEIRWSLGAVVNRFYGVPVVSPAANFIGSLGAAGVSAALLWVALTQPHWTGFALGALVGKEGADLTQHGVFSLSDRLQHVRGPGWHFATSLAAFVLAFALSVSATDALHGAGFSVGAGSFLAFYGVRHLMARRLVG